MSLQIVRLGLKFDNTMTLNIVTAQEIAYNAVLKFLGIYQHARLLLLLLLYIRYS